MDLKFEVVKAEPPSPAKPGKKGSPFMEALRALSVGEAIMVDCDGKTPRSVSNTLSGRIGNTMQRLGRKYVTRILRDGNSVHIGVYRVK